MQLLKTTLLTGLVGALTLLLVDFMIRVAPREIVAETIAFIVMGLFVLWQTRGRTTQVPFWKPASAAVIIGLLVFVLRWRLG